MNIIQNFPVFPQSKRANRFSPLCLADSLALPRLFFKELATLWFITCQWPLQQRVELRVTNVWLWQPCKVKTCLHKCLPHIWCYLRQKIKPSAKHTVKVHLFLGRWVIKIKSQGPSLATKRPCTPPTRTSTEQPTVQDGFPSTWLWHKRWTSDDFPTPASAQREQLLGGGARVTGGQAGSSTELNAGGPGL